MKATKTTKSICIILVLSIVISGCASSTLFQSEPSNASVYVSGFKMGSTPYVYTDRKIAGSKTAVSIKKEGYKDYETILKRNERGDVGAFLGGMMCMVPFLWIMKYDPIHSYVLEKAGNAQPGISPISNSNYLRAEDERFIIEIDSLKRVSSLPDGLKEEIESAMNIGAGYNAATGTYQSRFEMPKLNKDNDYVLIYIKVNEKKDLNLKGLNEPRFRPAYLKDKFGEFHGSLLYRGPNTMSYGGSIINYNPNLASRREKELKNELFVFLMLKKQVPIQMQLNYNYRENSQLKIGKMEIILIED